MTLLGQAAAFALGVFVSIRIIAALYGILDLWCTIRTAWAGVLGRILGWGGWAAALLFWLTNAYRTAFASGLQAFLLFYLGLYAVRNLAVGVLRWRSRRAASQG